MPRGTARPGVKARAPTRSGFASTDMYRRVEASLREFRQDRWPKNSALAVSSQDGVQVAGSAQDHYHQLPQRVLEHLLHHPETRCNLTKLAFFDLLDGQEVAFVALVKPIEETDLAARRPNRKANDPFGQSNPTASRRALGFPGVTPVPSRWDQPLAQSGQRLSDFSNRTVNDWLRGA